MSNEQFFTKNSYLKNLGLIYFVCNKTNRIWFFTSLKKDILEYDCQVDCFRSSGAFTAIRRPATTVKKKKQWPWFLKSETKTVLFEIISISLFFNEAGLVGKIQTKAGMHEASRKTLLKLQLVFQHAEEFDAFLRVVIAYIFLPPNQQENIDPPF